MSWALNVMTGRATEVPAIGAANGTVDEPMTTAATFVARLIRVFEMVMAEPGLSVWDPRKNCEEESAVRV